ncbi:hypothetical protein B484DRAFT_444336 [Ochromonadaceae sp. CCMP2298]|nr:hypothetical protein B484DRAFT_444336 [Ochromonadaceae sp. CCMP2298]
MSLSSSVDRSFLPFLPGYRGHVPARGPKRNFFTIVNGEVIEKEGLFPSELPEDSSVMSIGKPRLNKRKPRQDMAGVTLCFMGYYTERPIDRPSGQIRSCNVYFFVDDGTLKIVEKRQPNGGVSQGTIVRRAIIPKADGGIITEIDLGIGRELVVYGRTFSLVDCDPATREFMQRGQPTQDASQEMSVDSYQESRNSLQPEKGGDEWGKFHSKKNDNKVHMEARLGHLVDNQGREGFIRYGTRQLRFKCLWDNTEALYGDVMEFSLNYYLCDDTVEISSVPDPSRKEQLPGKLLKKSKLPKNFATSMTQGERATSANFFHWSDIAIGMRLEVFGRKLRVIDADRGTREFFESVEFPLERGIVIPKPVVVVHERDIPPPTGFGSEEDSLRSVSGSLMPGPMPMKKLGESKVLSFFCSLLSGGPDDSARRFVISYYLLDNTLKIVEPPIQNSGFVGGVFLSRREIKKADKTPLTERDMHVGAKVRILMHQFDLLDANEGTMRWMEDKLLPRSNFHHIVDKLRPTLLEPAISGELLEQFRSLEQPELPGRTTKEAATEVFALYGLMNDSAEGLVEQDLRTLLRAHLNTLPHFSYEYLVEQIVNPTDEFA